MTRIKTWGHSDGEGRSGKAMLRQWLPCGSRLRLSDTEVTFGKAGN